MPGSPSESCRWKIGRYHASQYFAGFNRHHHLVARPEQVKVRYAVFSAEYLDFPVGLTMQGSHQPPARAEIEKMPVSSQ